MFCVARLTAPNRRGASISGRRAVWIIDIAAHSALGFGAVAGACTAMAVAPAIFSIVVAAVSGETTRVSDAGTRYADDKARAKSTNSNPAIRSVACSPSLCFAALSNGCAFRYSIRPRTIFQNKAFATSSSPLRCYRRDPASCRDTRGELTESQCCHVYATGPGSVFARRVERVFGVISGAARDCDSQNRCSTRSLSVANFAFRKRESTSLSFA